MSELKVSGQITKGPHLARTMSGTPVCRFHMVEEPAPGAANPLRLDVFTSGGLASICAGNLCCGSRVSIAGRLGLREMRHGGFRYPIYAAVADSVQPFGQQSEQPTDRRIEREARVVHCKREPYDVYIGRGRCPGTEEPGHWGNPFRIGHDGDRAEVIERYRSWLWSQIKAGQIDPDELAALHGKTLGCWCAPEPCHGEVLAAAAAWAAIRRA